MSSLFCIHDKVAVVTGASSGLGRQFALALAREGAKVAILARRADRLEQVKAEVEALGCACLAVTCDVADSSSIKEAVGAVVQHYGRIDILVNNAGIGITAPAESQTNSDWEAMLRTNLSGVYYMTREVGSVMIRQNYGKIINIASIHGLISRSGGTLSAYCATKGGVVTLTRALANEWAKHNITVNAIAPAYFESEMTEKVFSSDAFREMVKARCPMGRPGREGELDGALVYFASDASAYTTGQLLAVDGGWTTM